MNQSVFLDKLIALVAEISGHELDSLDTDQDLYATSVLDSFSLIQLIPAIESTYNCTLPTSSLTQANFRTISDIHNLLLQITASQVNDNV